MRLIKSVRTLLAIAGAAALLGASPSIANAESLTTAAPVVKVTTVKYSAQKAFPSFSQYDSKSRSSCKKASGGAYACKTYDAKKNTAGLGHYALCFDGRSLTVPASVVRAAQRSGGIVGVQLRLSLSKLHGGGYWKGYPAMWSGTFKKAGTQVLPGGGKWMPYYASASASDWVNVGLCLKANTTVTIKSLSISYRTVLN